jgi:hypothetical protein
MADRIYSLPPCESSPGGLVVGVSHECDFPAEARTRPILTGSALRPGMTAAELFYA